MSLIVKTTEKTDSNNTISLPPAIDSSKISISSGDFIVSYNTLEEGNVHKKFLTTDCLTEDATEDSAVKVLSMSAFSAYEGQIFDIISNTNNNNVCTVVYSTTVAPTTATLYNVLSLGTITLHDETYFEEDDTTFDAIDTNTGITPAPENLFQLPTSSSVNNMVLKILKDGIYKINYSMYFRLTNANTTAFTPHIKFIRGISNGEETAKIVHHSSVMTDLPEPIPVSNVSYFPSYIIGKTDTAITPAAPSTYFYNVNGSVTISVPNHGVDMTEYLGIYIGLTNTHTFATIDGEVGTSVLYFVTNIEYIGT